jgi:hypothetical protein
LFWEYVVRTTIILITCKCIPASSIWKPSYSEFIYENRVEYVIIYCNIYEIIYRR